MDGRGRVKSSWKTDYDREVKRLLERPSPYYVHAGEHWEEFWLNNEHLGDGRQSNPGVYTPPKSKL